MENRLNDKKAVQFFMILLVLLCGLVYAGWYLLKQDGLIAALMWAPGLAGIITQRRYYKGQNVLGFRWGTVSAWMLAFLLPALYLGLSYGGYWLLKPDDFLYTLLGANYINLIIPVLFGFVMGLFLGLGEEIGWRGFLMPKLHQLYGLWPSILIAGIIWSVYHWPLIFGGSYQPGTPLWFLLPSFTLFVTSAGALFYFLRLKSNSVWPAAVIHAVHNLLDQMIFDPSTLSDGSKYWVGETGIITVTILVVMALVSVVLIKKHSAAQKVL